MGRRNIRKEINCFKLTNERLSEFYSFALSFQLTPLIMQVTYSLIHKVTVKGKSYYVTDVRILKGTLL